MKEYHFQLRYGKGNKGFILKSKKLLGVLKVGASRRSAPTSIIESALDQPIHSLPFNDFFSPKDSIVIVCSDITRYTGSDFFLPILIKRLSHIGIKDSALSITIALGIHRAQTEDEMRELVGDKLYGRIRVFNHNPQDESNLKLLGITKRGTKAEFNRRVVEADKIILTGALGFHYFAGFSGGRKGMMPGVASFGSCVDNHLLALNPQGGKNPHAVTGVLKGNPVHEDMVEACQNLPPLFLLNTILSPDKKIIKAVSGSLTGAFERGCEMFREDFSISIKEKADLVIASCGGFPKDINFIQAHKSMDYAMGALREGGVMILLAECAQVYGHPTFHQWFKYQDLKEFEDNLKVNYEVNGQTAYLTLLKAKKAKIILISQLPPHEVRQMSMIPAEDLEEALSLARTFLGDNPTIYIIPEAGSTLPILVNEKGKIINSKHETGNPPKVGVEQSEQIRNKHKCSKYK
jgi:nickel-dependent lactate racemase